MFLPLLRKAFLKLDVSGQGKREVLKSLLDGFPENHFSEEKKEWLLELLVRREEAGTTAVGDELALPHAFVEGLETPQAVLGISRQGEEMGALDGQRVYVFLLVLLPDSEAGRLSKRAIFRKALIAFSDRFIRQRLRQALSPQEVREVIEQEEIFSRTASITVS
ncbi:MAG: PTS sugar transporter subunit IIA [Candidatus Omnitrophica bacterium]|nr:PTS sugar transporter subunit IIA [Candidatus Omnitrophota bacterium]